MAYSTFSSTIASSLGCVLVGVTERCLIKQSCINKREENDYRNNNTIITIINQIHGCELRMGSRFSKQIRDSPTSTRCSQ